MQIVYAMGSLVEYLGTLMLAAMLVGGLIAVWVTSRGAK